MRTPFLLVTLLFTSAFLSGCGSSDSGHSFSVESDDDYHAIRINSQEWMKVDGSLQFTGIEATDEIKIISLCETVELRGGASANGSIYTYSELSNQFIESDRLLLKCENNSVTQNNQSSERDEATLYSQQGDEVGISGFDASIDSTLKFVDGQRVVFLERDIESIENNNPVPITFMAKAYKASSDEYYFLYDDNFTYQDGDNIGLDFYGPNSYLALIEKMTDSDTFFSRSFCLYGSLYCFPMIDFNGKKLVMPDMLNSTGSYFVTWGEYRNGGHYGYDVRSKVPDNENLLARNVDVLENIEFNLESHEGLILKELNFNGFSNPDLSYYYQFSFDEFRLIVRNHVENPLRNIRTGLLDMINLDLLPEVPEFFKKSASDTSDPMLGLTVFQSNANEDTIIESHRFELFFTVPMDSIQ